MISERKNAIRLTDRGFAVYGEFEDTRGNTIRVQESSSATEDACWIFCQDSKGNGAHVHLGTPQAYSPHMDRATVKKLRDALDRFLLDEEEADQCHG